MLVEDLQSLIQGHISDASVIVESEDQVHFEARVISDAFVDKTPVQRQRLVYEVVGEHISSGAIHALSLKTYTKEEWQRLAV